MQRLGRHQKSQRVMTIDNKNEEQQPDEPIPDAAAAAAAASDDDEKDQSPNNGKEITEKVRQVKH